MLMPTTNPAPRPPPPRNPLAVRKRRPGFNISQLYYGLARKKLDVAYAEIESDPALKRTYEEYCAYWRAVQSFLDRSPDPAYATDAERWALYDERV